MWKHADSRYCDTRYNFGKNNLAMDALHKPFSHVYDVTTRNGKIVSFFKCMKNHIDNSTRRVTDAWVRCCALIYIATMALNLNDNTMCRLPLTQEWKSFYFYSYNSQLIFAVLFLWFMWRKTTRRTKHKPQSLYCN